MGPMGMVRSRKTCRLVLEEDCDEGRGQGGERTLEECGGAWDERGGVREGGRHGFDRRSMQEHLPLWRGGAGRGAPEFLDEEVDEAAEVLVRVLEELGGAEKDVGRLTLGEGLPLVLEVEQLHDDGNALQAKRDGGLSPDP